jgi:hypothetical protein
MAQTLMTTDNPYMLVRAQVALDEANKAANNSCIRIIGLCKKLEFPANRIRGRVRRFRKKSFFASKRNEAKRDPFRMRFARSREKNKIFFRFFLLQIFCFRPKQN